MRVGCISYATDQGIAHLAKAFYDHGVITDVAIFHHSSRVNHPEWFPGAMVIARRPFDWPEIRAWIDQMDAMLFFETPFDWIVLDYCRRKGIRTAICPMYECSPRHIPVQPDKWLCPSLLDCEYFPGSPFIPVPVEQPWQERKWARRFLHNGGHLGLRGHKGTLEIMRAMELVKSPITMTIRSQDAKGLAELIRKVPSIKWDRRVSLSMGGIPYGQLFDGFDVFIMAEKYNGLSLPLAEARASGMLVMTSDRFPMNTWLPREPLIPVEKYTVASISGAYKEFQEATVRPEDIAAKIDQVYDTDISEYSRSGKAWAEENSWEKLKPRWVEALA